MWRDLSLATVDHAPAAARSVPQRGQVAVPGVKLAIKSPMRLQGARQLVGARPPRVRAVCAQAAAGGKVHGAQVYNLPAAAGNGPRLRCAAACSSACARSARATRAAGALRTQSQLHPYTHACAPAGRLARARGRRRAAGGAFPRGRGRCCAGRRLPGAVQAGRAPAATACSCCCCRCRCCCCFAAAVGVPPRPAPFT